LPGVEAEHAAHEIGAYQRPSRLDKTGTRADPSLPGAAAGLAANRNDGSRKSL